MSLSIIGVDLERFLVRIVFCLFADDTGVFERDIFMELIETRTNEDGADLGQWLDHLFQVLDTPASQRVTTLDEDLARFPYINGDLFKGPLAWCHSTPPCVAPCWTSAALIGRKYRLPSSGRCFSQ